MLGLLFASYFWERRVAVRFLDPGRPCPAWINLFEIDNTHVLAKPTCNEVLTI